MRLNVNQRLDANTMPEPNTGCWLWIGSIGNQGYGRLYANNKQNLAHRLSWGRFNGVIPKGMYICHKCDVPSCINPDHLFLGTQKDNIRDASKKGRIPRGEDNCLSKLMNNQVIGIRKATGSHDEIAATFNISRANVGAIKRGETWRHLIPGEVK